jgi:hypothetical protein
VKAGGGVRAFAAPIAIALHRRTAPPLRPQSLGRVSRSVYLFVSAYVFISFHFISFHFIFFSGYALDRRASLFCVQWRCVDHAKTYRPSHM